MYRLFGDLFLDPPPPDRLEALEKCRPKLRDLETREKPSEWRSWQLRVRFVRDKTDSV